MSGITREERNACRRCVREVRARNIDSQLDFRRWALRSHPDKGGSVQEFQRVSECVDMVYRDSCMDQIREWDRGRRGVNELARTEAIIASVVQSFSASDIESGGIEVDPWVGRWNFRRKGSEHHKGATLRLGHKRILGIPLRLYSELEAKVHLNKKNKPVLLSIGPNWIIPKTKRCLSLNISCTSICSTFAPFLQPKTLDIKARVSVRGLKLEAGCLLDHTSTQAIPRKISELRPLGLTLGAKVEVIHVSAREGVKFFGFKVDRKSQKQENEEDNGNGNGDSSIAASGSVVEPKVRRASSAASPSATSAPAPTQVPIPGEGTREAQGRSKDTAP